MKIEEFPYYLYPEKPELISKDQRLFDKLNRKESWLAEYKYNGSRLQLHMMNGEIQFWDRHGKQLAYNRTPSKEIIELLKNADLPNSYNLFDGELRHNKVVGIQHKIILYDVIIYNGELLIKVPFQERRKILEKHFGVESEPVGITKQFQTDFHKMYNISMENEELEGLILKNKNGVLDVSRTSNRNSLWMKKVRKQTGRHRF